MAKKSRFKNVTQFLEQSVRSPLYNTYSIIGGQLIHSSRVYAAKHCVRKGADMIVFMTTYIV